MRALLIGGLLLLAGCAAPAPVVRPVRVEVPVPVPCRMATVQAPEFAASGLKKTDSLETKVRVLLADRRQRIGYERQLNAAVSACQ